MPRWCWGYKKTGRGRPYSWLFLSSLPKVKEFVPRPLLNREPIELSYPEYEVLRLIDLQNLTQEETAKKMNTSRGTVWRLLQSARKKVTQALVDSRPLIVLPKGEVKKV